eukprot:767704-Hanusia_phi.AAC.1
MEEREWGARDGEAPAMAPSTSAIHLLITELFDASSSAKSARIPCPVSLSTDMAPSSTASCSPST